MCMFVTSRDSFQFDPIINREIYFETSFIIVHKGTLVI